MSDAQMFKPLGLGLEEGLSGLCFWGRVCQWEYFSLTDVGELRAAGRWVWLCLLWIFDGQDDFLL